jgi:8-oxo-dGTP diphosphatase
MFASIGAALSITVMHAVHVTRYALARIMGATGLAGVRIIIRKDDSVLLVTHWYAPWLWTLPGGGIKNHESAKDAAVRETNEETGLLIEKIELVAKLNGSIGQHDVVSVFQTDRFSGSVNVGFDIEIKSRRWFAQSALPKNIIAEHKRLILDAAKL